MNYFRQLFAEHRGFFFAVGLVGGVYVLCKVFGKKDTGEVFIDVNSLLDTVDLDDPPTAEELRILRVMNEIIEDDAEVADSTPEDDARLEIMARLIILVITGDDGRHVPIDPEYVDELPMLIRLTVFWVVHQLEGGVLPMDPHEIKNIRTIMVDQEMLNKTSSCSVCLDTLEL